MVDSVIKNFLENGWKRPIGLIGPAQVGKSTVARMLAENYGYTRHSFAKKLRDLAVGIDPYIRTNTGEFRRLSELLVDYGYEWVKQQDDGRRFYQRLGTEGVRNVLGEDTWVTAAINDIGRDDVAVFDDVRFPNEAYAIEDQLDGWTVRIYRERITSVNNHVSETFWQEANVTWELDNSGTVAQLALRVREMMEEMRG